MMNPICKYTEQDLLDLPLGLSQRVQLILAGKNLVTVEKVLKTSIVDFISFGLSVDEIEHLKTAVSDYVPSATYMSVLEYSSILATKWRHITFGCQALDKITRNGLPIRGITEIVGESGSGKTQICLQLALNVQLSFGNGGLEKSTIYICTENAFPSKRLVQIADFYSKRFQIDSWLDNIFVEHCPDTETLLNCICKQLPRLICQRPIGLIVIDSVAGVFRLESNAISRAECMRKMALKLQTLADEHECAVVCVNQVTAAMNENVRNKYVPALGLAWSNLVTTQFKIRKLAKQISNIPGSCISNIPIKVRNFEIGFSPELPKQCTEFIITEKGICDVPDK